MLRVRRMGGEVLEKASNWLCGINKEGYGARGINGRSR